MTTNRPTHPLHKAIGSLLSQLSSSNIEVILDEACGGEQQISLFVGSTKERRNRLCKVDAMIIQNGKVRIIIEIEESGFIPTKICGKYLTSALSTNYLWQNTAKELSPDSILFLQIVAEKEFSNDKTEQLVLLEKKLNELHCGCVKQYELLFIKQDSDENEVTNKVKHFLTNSHL
jgi:hypothetical protein